MNKISTKILSLMICLELVLAPFPKTFAAETTATTNAPAAMDEVTAAAFFKSVQAEAERVFDPETGCAKVDEKGNATVINQTTQAAIHGDPEAKGSFNCQDALTHLAPRWAKAQELKKEYEAADKKDRKDGTCSDCSIAAKNLNTNFLIPEGGTCSLKEQRDIAADRKSGNDPKCAFSNEFSPSKMLSLDCAKAFLEQFWTSLQSMAQTAWHTVTAVGSAVANFFTGNKQLDNNAADRGLQFAGMSAAEVTQAQKDPDAAKRNWFEKVGHAMESLAEWMGENFLIDVPAYKDLYKCAKCGDRGNAVCKMFGVLGKDMVKYAIFDLISGGAINLVGKTLESAFSKTLIGKAVELTGARAIVKVTGEKFASLGAAAVDGFAKFSADGAGKFASDFFLKPAWQITRSTGKILLGANQVLDTVMKAPTHLFVRSGEKLAVKIAEATAVEADAKSMLSNYDIGKNVPKETGLRTVGDNVKDPAAEEVEMKTTASTAPKQMQEAAGAVKKTSEQARFTQNGKAIPAGNKVKISVDDILNAVEEKPEVVSNHSIRLPAVGADAKPHYFPLGSKNGEDVARVLGYRDNASAIVKMKDGSIYLAESGRALTPVAKKDLAEVDKLFTQKDVFQKQLDQNAEKQVESTMDVNGIKHTKVNSTVKPGEKDVEFKTDPECGNQTITVSAGRAL